MFCKFNRFHIFAAFLLCLSAQPLEIFVSSQQSCGASCTGTLPDPFDNLLVALNFTRNISESISIILLGDATIEHYLLYKEQDYAFPYYTQILLDDVKIRPLFCDEDRDFSDPLLSGRCIERDQKLTLIMKPFMPNFLVNTGISVQNIIFDWTDSSPSVPSSHPCISERIRCCNTDGFQNGIDCSLEYSTAKIWNSKSIFEAQEKGETSFKFSFIELKNFRNKEISSFILTYGAVSINIVFENSVIDDVVFGYGLMIHMGSKSDSLWSSISFSNNTFKKYNYWNRNRYIVENDWREGYLVYIVEGFRGNVNIIDSKFEDFNTAPTYLCPMYDYASNNFSSFTYSRTDIWQRHHWRAAATQSSLVNIEFIDGELMVKNCVFKNVIGTHGSVFYVDDSSWRSSFTFENNNFDNNFAMYSFANILIVVKSIKFIMDCPAMYIYNSNFTNSAGCPGSYGNVGYICYLDQEPPYKKIRLGDFEKYVADLDTSFPLTYFEVKNSRFENNLLAVSNSLAIVGSMYSIIEGNVFKDNGGTTAEIARYSLGRSNYFLNMKPDQDFESIDSLIHFGQSTVLYVDRAFKMHFSDNTFQNNFGPWEGSYLLGTDLTVRTCYPFIRDLIEMRYDVYKDHLGIPPHLAEIISNEGLKKNSYTPPLITFGWDQDPWDYFSYEPQDRPFMALSGVQFINNIASYDIVKGCSYNSLSLKNKCSWIKSKWRYRSGFIRFLSGGDILEDETYENTYQFDAMFFYGQNHQVSLTNVIIINNTLETEGCLFPSLSLRKYFLTNVRIENNKINPSANYLTEDPQASEPLLDQALENRDGLFCLFYKENFLYEANPKFLATDILVLNNIGTIFNTYPGEANSFKLMNSIFINNTCPYGSMIISNQLSDLFFLNNIFYRNFNALGILLYSSSNTEKQNNFFHTYLKNDGKHASIAYSAKNTALQEAFTKAYWNNANPKFRYFKDQIKPQGALYFIESGESQLTFSHLKENSAYAGLFVSIRGHVLLKKTNITDNYVYGSGILGVFTQASSLVMKHIKMTNNSIIDNGTASREVSFIKLYASELEMKDIEISQTPKFNKGNLLNAADTHLSLEDISIYDFDSDYNGPLVIIDSSQIFTKNLYCDGIKSLLKATKSVLDFRSVVIKNFQPSSSSQSLMDLMGTTVTLRNFAYIGGSDSGDYISLVTGNDNDLEIMESYFLNPIIGQNKVFDLADTTSLLITKTTFEYSDPYPQTVILSLGSTQKAVIQESLFIFVGSVIESNIVFDSISFLSNTILTYSERQNIKLTSSNLTYFVDNNMLRLENQNLIQVFPESQIDILDSLGHNTFQHNIFMSLYGAEGIIKAQALNQPYSVDSIGDLFIDNTGYGGGAFRLDDSLSSSNAVTSLSQINIKNSIFLLNKAINSNDIKGRGGAIYQTTSTQAKQITNLINTVFIKNSADISGGAIYFDYFPPNVDQESKFIENYAARINHIGSYPVKLGYYKGEPKPRNPYSPNQRLQRSLQQSNDSIREWDNIQSGLYELGTYTFEILDMFDQIVYDDNTSRLDIIPKGIPKENWGFFSTKPYLVAEDGIYTFNNFRLNYKVGNSIDVTFRSTAIKHKTQIPLDIPLTTDENITIKVNFRRCHNGESISQDGVYTTCIKCQPGFWQTSPNLDIPYCAQCKEESTYCLGGDQVGPKKGYWRLNQTSNIVLECPEPTACLGNEVDPQSLDNISLNPKGDCEYGYKGNLCSNCIFGWAKTRDGSCTNCQTDVWFYIRLFITLLFQIAVVIQGIKGTMLLSEDSDKNHKMSLNGAILIRILTNYLQFISLVAGIPVTWPEVIKRFSSPISKAASISENVFTIDCIFPAEENLPIKIVFIKLILGSIGGFGFVLLGGLFWAICFWVQRKPILGNSDYINKFTTTAIVICFMFQTSAIQNSFGFFACINLYREDNPVYFFNKDYDVLCWEGEHLHWALGLGIPSIVLWAFVLPFLGLYVMMKNRNRLDTKEISNKYSFLYGGYVRDKYFWEFIIMARKFIFIALLLTSGLYSPQFEIYSSIPLILIFFSIHYYAQPYADIKLNYLETVSLVCSSTVNFCGLYFELVPQNGGLDIVFIIIGLSANVFFFGSFMNLYFAHQIRRLLENEKVKKILLFLGQKFYPLKFLKRETKRYEGQSKFIQLEKGPKKNENQHEIKQNDQKQIEEDRRQGSEIISSKKSLVES